MCIRDRHQHAYSRVYITELQTLLSAPILHGSILTPIVCEHVCFLSLFEETGWSMGWQEPTHRFKRDGNGVLDIFFFINLSSDIICINMNCLFFSLNAKCTIGCNMSVCHINNTNEDGHSRHFWILIKNHNGLNNKTFDFT